MNKVRYIMMGGFLGAGKSTAILKLARRLKDQGLKVGLITNDQGNHLVDTTVVQSHGFPVEEISGGCFCCRFNSLMEAAQRLSKETAPDIFIAEPVGSCTDLVATVTYPLRRIYGDRFLMAPLSVLVDPVRALRMLGLEEGGKFSSKVHYIYRKQLEEADLIVMNKADLLNSTQSQTLRQALVENFPQAEILEVSSRNGKGLDFWFDRITTAYQESKRTMEVDYETYAEGEALLGWLNATVQLSSQEMFDGNEFLNQWAKRIQERLNQEGAEIAHLKMTLNPDDGLGEVAVINLVRNDYVPELSQNLSEPLRSGQLILNIRAETSPEILHDTVKEILEKSSRMDSKLKMDLEHLEYFRPGKPMPTHRMIVPA